MLKTPDFTPAQLVAGVPIIANLLNAFGVYSLTVAQQGALEDTIKWSVALLGADALIRIGRAIGLGKNNSVEDVPEEEIE